MDCSHENLRAIAACNILTICRTFNLIGRVISIKQFKGFGSENIVSQLNILKMEINLISWNKQKQIRAHAAIVSGDIVW